ncbi:Condensin complex subunit 2 [Glycine soja]
MVCLYARILAFRHLQLITLASCKLEAGVTIYSLRVDSVHSEAYKVLARMNRACQDTEQVLSINKIEVQYDKTSKQVNVQVLKTTLWDHIQESVHIPIQVNNVPNPFTTHIYINGSDIFHGNKPTYVEGVGIQYTPKDCDLDLWSMQSLEELVTVLLRSLDI